MGKNCVICNAPSGMYPLCRKHLQMKNDGKVLKCEKCGTWYLSDTSCPNCATTTTTSASKNSKQDQDSSELTCIICGNPSNGKHFCHSCYYKYRNKDIFLKIKKCEFPCGDPIDEFYDGIYECADGHIVKSWAEQSIDNYLCEKGILHGYELPLDVGTEKPLKPDFCLLHYLGKDKHVYIEYFGLKGDPDYDQTTDYKMKLYRKMGITLICMYPKTDQKNIRFALDTKLNKAKIKEGTIHYEQK